MFVNSDLSHHFVQKLNESVRWQEIVSAAFDLVAQKGLEGLRVREVADQVGINNATLHYYFRNKQALVEAILQYTIYHIATTHDPDFPPPSSATERLQQHFADHLYQYRLYPERFVVITEIILRSFRDVAVHAILLKQQDLWHKLVISILQEGMTAGEFDPNRSPEIIANHITALFRGISLSREIDENDWSNVSNQLIEWIRIE